MIGARLPNWLGDVLLARRALEVLLARAGAGGVVAAVPDGLLPLLQALYPGAEWRSAGSGWRGARVLGRAWRRRAVHRVYLFPTSLSAQLAGSWSGAAERVGFGHRPGERREWEAGLLVTHRVRRRPRGERHLEDEYLDLVGGAARDAGASPLRPIGGPLPDELSRSAVSPYVLLAPGAKYGPAKRWPPERFAEAGRLFLADGPACRAIVVGDAAEQELCREVADRIGPAAVSLAGRTDLVQLANLVGRAAGVVANDSGVAHLGGALGTPTVALFGSTEPAWTAPRGPHVRSLHERLRCTPCFRRTCPWRDDAYACLRVLEPRAVVAALRDLAVARVA